MAVLVVEDDPSVGEFVARGLSEEGFAIRLARDGGEALAAIRRESFELVLLDWMLPTLSGLQILKSVRATGDLTPILMLTARDAVENRVAALDFGADGYLVKPFAFTELVARAQALIRRARHRLPQLRVGDLRLDLVERTAFRGGRSIPLSEREFALLRCLMEQAGTVVSRAQLHVEVWEQGPDVPSNVVDVYIYYLRLKVDAGFPTALIHTVRNVGYVVRETP